MNTQIIENNKLLAEFMGCYQNNEGFWGFENTPNHKKWHTDRFLDCTKYDTDWNWLMQVVEKIENYNEFTNVLFAPQGCAIDVYIENGFAFSNDCNTKIEAVYNACVEFVQWYNSSKEA
jgi:hypothetical protein